MIYVELTGGLGNQLFQYSMAKNVQSHLNERIVCLTKSFENDELRDLSLSRFNLNQDIVFDDSYDFGHNHNGKKMYLSLRNKIEHRLFGAPTTVNDKKYRSRIHAYERIGIYTHEAHLYLDYTYKRYSHDIYIKGLWHYPKYFNHLKNELSREFQLKEEVKTESYREVHETESVCVHIRRGDYLNYSYYNVCDIDYFRESIKQMRILHPQCVFFVFSDDMKWVKDNLKENVVYVDDQNPDYIDFEIMRNCKHFIISNSTFSWWAAYLGRYENKTVITPSLWYSDGRNKEWLNLDDWLIMPIKGA